VNDYEAQMLQERTGRTIEELAKLVKAVVVTLGARGSVVYAGARTLEIPSVQAREVVDPTGCGDAFRAGLLYGLAADFDWPTTGRLASLLGAIKIACRGGQNHCFTRDEIAQRYRDAYGSPIW
jgi:adenosine kinase